MVFFANLMLVGSFLKNIFKRINLLEMLIGSQNKYTFRLEPLTYLKIFSFDWNFVFKISIFRNFLF